jgi:hypothetical protein
MKFLPLGYLLGNTFLGITIGGIKGIVVAEGAASGSFSSVAIRAGETCIYRNLLNPVSKPLPEEIGIGIKPAGMTPGVGR